MVTRLYGVYVFGSGNQPSPIKSDWGERWLLTQNKPNCTASPQGQGWNSCLYKGFRHGTHCKT